MIVNAERLVRDTNGRYEVWRAEVNGREVMAEIKYADYLAVREPVCFRDWVALRLVDAANR